MRKFPKVVKKFPNYVKKFPKDLRMFPKDFKKFSKVVRKFRPKSCCRANLSKMNENETKWPKIDEVDQDSENLVEQIEQSELWSLLKVTKMYQWNG